MLTPLETMNLQQNCRLYDCKCAFIFLAASSSFAFQNLPNQSASSKESIFPSSRLTLVISILHFIPCHLTLANFPCHATYGNRVAVCDEFMSLASMISFTWRRQVPISLQTCLDCCFYLQTLHLFLCLVKESESLPGILGIKLSSWQDLKGEHHAGSAIGWPEVLVDAASLFPADYV